MKDVGFSFETTLVERERYVKELWKTYEMIISTVHAPGWTNYLKEIYKPTMIPIQRVVRAPRFKSYRYQPPQKIYYVKTDKTGEKVDKSYLLTPPKTLY